METGHAQTPCEQGFAGRTILWRPRYLLRANKRFFRKFLLLGSGLPSHGTEIPKLLKLLDIRRAIVTIHAMGRQTKIADQIIEQGRAFILALKGNQGTLHKDVEQRFGCAELQQFYPEKFVHATHHLEAEKKHGRIEGGKVTVTDVTDWITKNSIPQKRFKALSNNNQTMSPRALIHLT